MKINFSKTPEYPISLESFDDNLLKEVIVQTLCSEHHDDCWTVVTTASKLQLVSQRWYKHKQVVEKDYKNTNAIVFTTLHHLEILIKSSDQTTDTGNLLDTTKKLHKLLKSTTLESVKRYCVEYINPLIRKVMLKQKQEVIEGLKQIENNLKTVYTSFPIWRKNSILNGLQTVVKAVNTMLEEDDSIAADSVVLRVAVKGHIVTAFRTDKEKTMQQGVLASIDRKP
ncbi:MAG: hypothetical protein K0S74_702 [Chlamydiales bacterium]|jgi:hypothetical protein|nr:hypothetical protein [Chlamydiales bacterium]